MSTRQTGRLQLERLQSLGYRVRMLPRMRDVDTPAELSRCHGLLVAGGLTLVETDPEDDVDDHVSLTLHCADGRVSSPMPWARLGSRQLSELATRLGFVVVEDWRVDGRVFLALRRLL